MAGVVGLLLAAGQGTRFGSDKLLHPLACGTPMAVASARTLRGVCPRSIAVLRPEQGVLAGLLAAEGLEIVFSPESCGGMGHTLAAGVAASPDASGWLVTLADMPFIQPATLCRVADALADGAELAAAFVDGQRRELLALTGDEGARAVIGGNRGLLRRIETTDPGVLQDVDRPGDLPS